VTTYLIIEGAGIAATAALRFAVSRIIGAWASPPDRERQP
jgi:hypothetical protein